MAAIHTEQDTKIKTGRRAPKEIDSPRNQILSLLVNKDEKELIDNISAAMKLTRSAMLSRIVLTFAEGVRSLKKKKTAETELAALLQDAYVQFRQLE